MNSFLEKILRVFLNFKNSNLDNIYKKLEITAQKTEELKKIQQDLNLIQKKLIESKNKLISIINTTSEPIICIDLNYNIILWNDASTEMFKYTYDEIKNIGIVNILHETDRDLYKQAYDRLRSSFQKDKNISIKTKITTRVIDKNGNLIPIEMNISSWKNNGDLYLTLVLRNITERKMLYTEKRILSMVVDNIETGIFVLDLNLKIKLWNGVMEKITGYNREYVNDKYIFDIFYDLADSCINKIINEVLSGSDVNIYLVEFINQSNISHYLKIKFNSVYDEYKSEIVGILCIIEQINNDEIKLYNFMHKLNYTGKFL